MAKTSARKKLLLFPPMQTFPSSLVQIASGGITNSSLSTDALAGRVVRLIQRGVISIATGANNGTAAITAVDMAKTELHYLGQCQSGSNVDSWPAMLRLMSTVQVRADLSRNLPLEVTELQVSWEAVTYW